MLFEHNRFRDTVIFYSFTFYFFHSYQPLPQIPKGCLGNGWVSTCIKANQYAICRIHYSQLLLPLGNGEMQLACYLCEFASFRLLDCNKKKSAISFSQKKTQQILQLVQIITNYQWPCKIISILLCISIYYQLPYIYSITLLLSLKTQS